MVDVIFERISLLEKWKEPPSGRKSSSPAARVSGETFSTASVSAAAFQRFVASEVYVADSGVAATAEMSVADSGVAVTGEVSATASGVASTAEVSATASGLAATAEASGTASGVSATAGVSVAASGVCVVAIDLPATVSEVSAPSATSEETEADEKMDFHLGIVVVHVLYLKFLLPDLLYSGILMLAQKSASQYGDGEGALAFWKNSIADYNDEKKVHL